jgi:hypothetical protein
MTFVDVCSAERRTVLGGDPAAGRYRNGRFTAPRRMVGRPLAEFFSCGLGLTGPYIDS